tara:strand:+ start:2958 stop:3179 length:222 start_codon:yes stop_codon:yes gene_type:complete
MPRVSASNRACKAKISQQQGKTHGNNHTSRGVRNESSKMKYKIRDILADVIGVICLFAGGYMAWGFLYVFFGG